MEIFIRIFRPKLTVSMPILISEFVSSQLYSEFCIKSFNEKHVLRSSLYCAFLHVYINFNFDLTKGKKHQTLYILFPHKN